MKPTSRRNFLKTGPVVVAVAAGSTTLNAGVPDKSSGFNHKLKLSLNVFSFNQLLREGKIDLFDVIRFCAENNFDAIDPTGYYFPGYPEVPPDTYINRFKREAFVHGLDISGTGVRNDFANPDASARKADKELIKKWVVMAAKLGSPNLRVFTGRSKHDGYEREQVFEWMAKELRECCDYGADHGVMIALQNHNEFLKTADDVDHLFALVDSKWFGLNQDIGSYRQKDPYKEIQQNIRHAVTWQIKENVWIGGEPVSTDYKKLIKLIKKSGYRGYLPLETLRVDPYKQIPVMLKTVRELIA
ncbi:MAG: sugar phosphate isomerase/epimerase family protein [Puniceicoccaceae bacterium]